jgi:multiple sugar transport system ATP-binding protein
MTLASRIGVIASGRLVQLGTPLEVYERPCNAYVASQLGTPPVNFLPASALPAPAAPPGTELVGARTEQLRIGAVNGRGANARLRRIEHLGDQSLLHIELGGHALVTLADPHASWRPGDALSVELVEPLYFDRAGQRLEPAQEGRHGP